MSGGLVNAGGGAGLPIKVTGDRAEFQMEGGQLQVDGFNDVIAVEATSGKAELSGGIITLTYGGTSTSFFRSAGTSQVVVRGGTFSGETGPFSSEINRTLFEARGEGQITVSGGTFLGEYDLDIRAANASSVVIHGSDFNLPMHSPIQPTRGTITGKLLDGQAIDWTFNRGPSATILLVPEPTSATMLAFGIATLLTVASGRSPSSNKKRNASSPP